MKDHVQTFNKFTKLNESINENVEVREYKVKDKHKAEDRLEELGIQWKDFIDHPDGTGFGTDGNLMAHYDEETGKLYVHVEPTGKEDIEIPSDEEIDKYKDFDALMQRYNSETDDVEGDEWFKEDEDEEDNNWDKEPSDSDLIDFDEF